MFPGMIYCILSRDLDFVVDMSALLRQQHADVFIPPHITHTITNVTFSCA